jgi:sigma-B regulation protein RsbU (phosphoserine phosphatase)
VRDRAAALERVLEITRELARPLDLTTLLGKVVDAALDILDADRGTVFLYDPQADVLISRVATGSGELRIPANKGFAGECVRTRQIVNVPDAYADPRFNPDPDKASGYKTRCILTIPLIGHDDALVGVVQVLNKRHGVFDEDDVGMATALAASCAVAIQRMRLLEDLLAKQRMERELEVARDIQTRVLPKAMPKLAGYEVAGWSRPADQTGGDIYDVIAGDNGVTFLLGDATGHGIGPALSVTQVRAMLRMASRLGAGLDDSFRHINDQLSDDLSSNRFVTAFLGVLDVRTHELTYHSGGQGPILHFQAATSSTTLSSATTLPMGMLPIFKPTAPRVAVLAPGDIMAAITDGIFEYESVPGTMFGEQRVIDIISRDAALPAKTILQHIVDEVVAFAKGAPQLDDMTLLIVKRL